MTKQEIKDNAPHGATHYKYGKYYSFYEGYKSRYDSLSTIKNQSYVWTNSGWKSIAGFDGFFDGFIELRESHSFDVWLERPSPN